MQAAAGPRHGIEKILALVLVAFLALDLLLVLPAYASELRLNRLHPSLPIVNLRPLADARDQIADRLAAQFSGPVLALAGGAGLPSPTPDLLETAVVQTATALALPSETSAPAANSTQPASSAPTQTGTQGIIGPSPTTSVEPEDALETAVVQTTTALAPASATSTLAVTSTPIPLYTPIPTGTQSTPFPSMTPSQVAVLTATVAHTLSPTPAWEATVEPTFTPVITASRTPTPIRTRTPSPTPSLAAPTPSKTKTPSPTPSLPAPAPTASSGKYYVAPNGHDSNPGTMDQPWQTLAQVQSWEFIPGDVVHFQRGGSWSGNFIIDDSGVEENPITFTAYGTGPAPVFTNPGGPGSSSPVEVRADWVVVRGFLVRDTYSAGVRISQGSDHNVIREMEVTNSGFGVTVVGQYNLVTGNYLHDLNMVNNTAGGDDDYGAVGVLIDSSYTNGNTTNYNEISYNRMDNCRAPSQDYGWDGGAVEWYVTNGTIKGTYVHHNWATDSDGFFEVGGVNGEVLDTVVAYNVSIDNGWFGQFSLSGKFGTKVGRFQIDNNTIVQTRPHQGAPDLPIVILTDDPTPDSLSISNNIIFVDGWDVARHSGFSHRNNVYFLTGGAQLGFALGEGEMIADPLFVDLSDKDFRLLSGSPAIDAAIHLGYSRDFDGNRVPSGEAPDIGAFEYGD